MHFNNRYKAFRAARRIGQVPRQSKGGEPIFAHELNPSSRGPNFHARFSYPKRNGEVQTIGVRNPHGLNHYVEHPDGHPHLPGPKHHESPHIHVTNPQGQKYILTYPSKITSQASKNGKLIRSLTKTASRSASKCVALAGVGLTFTNIASASESDRASVVLNEAGSWAGYFAGAAAGAAIGSAVPVIGTAMGAVIGGFMGSFIGDVITSPSEIQNDQPQERGGILLSGDIDLCSNLKFELDSVDKIFIDSNGNLILSSEKNKASIKNCSIKEEDFLLALVIVYRNFEISFSLDPWDPLNPDGPSYQKVFYPNILENTSIGQTLFDCDYIMKKLSFGLLPLPSNVKSTLDFSLDETRQDPAQQSRHRLWIISQNVPLDVKIVENDGSTFQCLEFGDVKMKCCSKMLTVDPTAPSGLRDLNEPENENSPVLLFAKQFTENYDKIAEQYPQFERLKNISKFVALAKYLRDSDVKINEDAILSSLSKKGIKVKNIYNSGPLKVDQHESGKEEVPRLTSLKSRSDNQSIRTIFLTGGIDLGTDSNWNVVDSYDLPEGITKQFLATINSTKDKNDQSREMKLENGDKALVIPLSILSPELPMNSILEQGEMMVNNDPLTALEIASSVIRLNERNKRAFNLLANSLSHISLHRDAVAAYMISAMMSDSIEDYESALSLADYEANMFLSEKLNLEVVCSWFNSYHIYCPVGWTEVQIEGVDDSLSQIYVSKPSSYIPCDSCEMLMISEIKDFPDFSILFDLMKNKEIDNEVIATTYISLVSKFFLYDSNPIVRRLMAKMGSYESVIIVYTIEIINGEYYANYHCWLIPNPSLKIDSALFMLLTCSDVHMFWMDEWATQIFDKSTEYNPPDHYYSYEDEELKKTIELSLLDLDNHQQVDEDDELKRAIELSKMNLNNHQQENEDDELKKAMELSKLHLNNHQQENDDDELKKAIELSKMNLNNHQQENDDDELKKAMELSKLDSNNHQQENEDEELKRAMELSKLHLNNHQHENEDEELKRAIELSKNDLNNSQQTHENENGNEDEDLKRAIEFSKLDF